jgi:hypothetical protein
MYMAIRVLGVTRKSLFNKFVLVRFDGATAEVLDPQGEGDLDASDIYSWHRLISKHDGLTYETDSFETAEDKFFNGPPPHS